MRQRRQRNSQINQNLDSFLDILTNTVGVLMFIGLFVSLLAVEAGTIIRTPLRADTNKKGQYFEVRNNQVFNLSDSRIDDAIYKVTLTLPRCSQPDISENIPAYLYDYYLQEVEKYNTCIRNRNAKLQTFSYDNGDYIVSFTEQGSIKYAANTFAQGESAKDLRKSESQFNQVLEQFNPDAHYIAFIVRPDSFPAFRAARQEAWNLGYEVGWEPLPQEQALIFGSGGRSIGVQ